MAKHATPILRVLPLISALLGTLAQPLPLRSQGDTPLIDTRSTSTGTVVNQEALDNLPSTRDPWSILSQAPGVQARAQGGQTGDAAGAAVGGTPLMSVDGVVIGDPAILGNSGTYTDFITDAIQGIEVQRNGAGAEYGRSVGGVIKVVTKGGTNEWQGSGRFLDGSGDAAGIDEATNPGFEFLVEVDEDGVHCLKGFRFLDGEAPIAGAEGANGPIRFGFDQGFSIAADPGSTTSIGAGGGTNLNLFQLSPCPGMTAGVSFFDAPAPVTPPTPTHLYFGQNGVYAVDMARVGAAYGIPGSRPGPSGLEDPHIFNSNFYLTGMSSYVNGGFQLGRGNGAPSTGGSDQGFFLYGVNAPGLELPLPQVAIRWDSYAVALQTGSSGSTPDIDGDGRPDSYFLSLASLQPACPNVLGDAFTAGAGGTGGGRLEADAGAPQPDCIYLQDRIRMNDYFNVSLGVRYDPELAGEGGADATSLFESGGGNQKPRIFGAFGGTTWDRPNRLGGPLVKDRFWIYGTYSEAEPKPTEEAAPLFSAPSYRDSNVYDLFANSPYTLGSIQVAPAGRGVQDVGLEFKTGTMGRASAPAADRYAPGGAALAAVRDEGEGGLEALANALDSPLLYVVARGGPTGDVFQVQIVHPESGPVTIDGLVAVEPVAATAEDRARFERELAGSGALRETVTAAGYCLQQDALAPPAGTLYRIASAEKQAGFAPMRRALDAARRLRDAGQLHPDSDPTDYFHSIRQWAVWTLEKELDREGFLDAFVERTEKNFRESGQAWSPEIAAAVRSYGEGRWTDILAILDAAEAAP